MDLDVVDVQILYLIYIFYIMGTEGTKNCTLRVKVHFYLKVTFISQFLLLYHIYIYYSSLALPISMIFIYLYWAL